MSTQQPSIIYTLTDEAPRLATASFLPIIRTFAPFVAGVGAMHYRRFLAFNVIGAGVWVVSFVMLGYYFGNLPVVKENFTLVIFAIIAGGALMLLQFSVDVGCGTMPQ